MPIRQTTPQAKIDAYVEERMERMKQAIIYNLCVVGEKVRNEALSSGSYTDRTKNLRSSVGYVVVVDGQVYKAGAFGKADGTSEGKATGEAYARSLAGKYPKGIVLIVVAGMDYAAYVSAKGKDVLDSAEMLADRLVPKMLKKLGFKG